MFPAKYVGRQNTLNTLKFSKKNSCEVGGGGGPKEPPQGEIFCS